MFNWKDFEETKTILSQVHSYRETSGQHHVSIRPSELRRWMDVASEDLEYLTIVDIAAVDMVPLKAYYDREIIYTLLNMGTHQRLNVHVLFNHGEILPSIKRTFPAAEWMEREQAEAFNLTFDEPTSALLLPGKQRAFPLLKSSGLTDWGHEELEPLPLLPSNPNKSEAPYPEESYVWKRYPLLSNVTGSNFEWWVCFDPARVVNSKVKIGYYHQGIEKLLESKEWQHGLQLVDKLNLGAAPTFSVAWARNLEELLRVKIPERAQAIRIVTLELARIAEHLTVMFEMCRSLKMDEQRLFINCREKIYELMEKYCGRRQGLGIIRVGGVREDLPHGWIVEYQSVHDLVTKAMRSLHNSLISNRHFRESLSGGSVDAQSVLQWGVSGPAMRAAGLNFDLRKSQPFYFYQDIDFDVPVGINGTSYDRYLIRFEEIFQSFRIITQVIDNLPLGGIINPDYDQTFFSLHQHLKSEVPKQLWNYSSLEAPGGEAGFLTSLGEDLIPYRVKIKSPSFALAQALPQFVHGLTEKQLEVCLASLGIRRAEMDR
jgi:NADH-quinone oxidoreductase subunit C/D